MSSPESPLQFPWVPGTTGLIDGYLMRKNQATPKQQMSSRYQIPHGDPEIPISCHNQSGLGQYQTACCHGNSQSLPLFLSPMQPRLARSTLETEWALPSHLARALTLSNCSSCAELVNPLGLQQGPGPELYITQPYSGVCYHCS